MSRRRKKQGIPRLVAIDEPWNWPEDNSPMLGGQQKEDNSPMLGGDRRQGILSISANLTSAPFRLDAADLQGTASEFRGRIVILNPAEQRIYRALVEAGIDVVLDPRISPGFMFSTKKGMDK